MGNIKDLTDAELVEAVAREVMGWDDIVHYGMNRLGILRTGTDEILNGCWEPFTDMNDLFMVLEGKAYTVDCSRQKKNFVVDLWDTEVETVAGTLQRAVLEATLEAERGK